EDFVERFGKPAALRPSKTVHHIAQESLSSLRSATREAWGCVLTREFWRTISDFRHIFHPGWQVRAATFFYIKRLDAEGIMAYNENHYQYQKGIPTKGMPRWRKRYSFSGTISQKII
ncbi:MAG TPA: hypothetical protein VIU33_08055, partial [Nitrospiria bacterium]